MRCEEASILLNALVDGELDAGHVREVEGHVATCPGCARKSRDYRAVHEALSAAAPRYQAPASLRGLIEGSLPSAKPTAAPTRRGMLKGFAMGSAMSAALAAGLVLVVVHREGDQLLLQEVVTAHLRSLQGSHLIDVQSTDQHTVKPWFNGKLDVAPPVIDLTKDDFTLVGGRLDYIDGRPVGAIVYRRRLHVINLFVAPHSGPTRAGEGGPSLHSLQGFNVWTWHFSDLSFWAVSDINAEELQEFGAKLEAALKGSS